MPPENPSSGDEGNEERRPPNFTFLDFGSFDGRSDGQRTSDESNDRQVPPGHPRLAHVILSFRSRVPQHREKATAAALESLIKVPISELPDGEQDCVICYEPLVDGEDAQPDIDSHDASCEKHNDGQEPADRPTAGAAGTSGSSGPVGGATVDDRMDPAEITAGETAGEAAGEAAACPDPAEENAEAEGHYAVRMPCNHVFGRSCIFSWLKNNVTCPICRGSVEGEEEPESEHQYQMLHMNLDVLMPEDMNFSGANGEQGVGESREQQEQSQRAQSQREQPVPEDAPWRLGRRFFERFHFFPLRRFVTGEGQPEQTEEAARAQRQQEEQDDGEDAHRHRRQRTRRRSSAREAVSPLSQPEDEPQPVPSLAATLAQVHAAAHLPLQEHLASMQLARQRILQRTQEASARAQARRSAVAAQTAAANSSFASIFSRMVRRAEEQVLERQQHEQRAPPPTNTPPSAQSVDTESPNIQIVYFTQEDTRNQPPNQSTGNPPSHPPNQDQGQ